MDKKLKLSTKVIYGTGDFYGGASATIIGLLFMFFLTDIIGLRAIYAGIIVFAGRFVDAITDPLMGNISDKTKSRYGRRSVYFLFFAIPVMVSFALLFSNWNFASETVSFIYYAVANALFSIVFTAVMVPYAALAPEIASDYNERTSLVSIRMAFSVFGALIAAVIPKMIIDSVGITNGYSVMSIIFGVIFTVIWFVMFSHMKGKETYRHDGQTSKFFRALLSTLKNKSFLPLVGIYLFAFIPLDITGSNFIYYLTYYIGRPELFSYVIGSMLITTILSLPLYVRLSKKIGKRKTFIFGAAFRIIVTGSMFLILPGAGAPMLIAFGILLGIGSGVSYAIPWAMLPEVIDADEVISKQRREGLYSGVMTFLRKLASSIALFIISLVLEISGYISSQGGEVVSQPSSAITAIRLIIILAPLVCLVFGIFAAYKFPISPKRYEDLKKYMSARKNGEKIDESEIAEVKNSVSMITGQDVEI